MASTICAAINQMRQTKVKLASNYKLKWKMKSAAEEKWEIGDIARRFNEKSKWKSNRNYIKTKRQGRQTKQIKRVREEGEAGWRKLKSRFLACKVVVVATLAQQQHRQQQQHLTVECKCLFGQVC